ncbi:SRPBCC family protein [Streptomyces sp. NPDC046915]|uniref:SRPBCC family protein n=1 Tax=Streptomyces sp. NPDC046915 TaxID=3155257 RepID=UPI0033C2E5F3
MEWTGQVYADTPTVSAKAYIDVTPERLWGYVSDIHLMPELSVELQGVEWLDGVTGPRVGNRFRGRSAHHALGEWETVSTIVDCEEPRRFAWAVGDPDHPTSVWRFTLRPRDAGTVLEQWAQLGPAPSGLSAAIEAMPDKEQKIVFVRLREFETGIKSNLAAIKNLAEREK